MVTVNNALFRIVRLCAGILPLTVCFGQPAPLTLADCIRLAESVPSNLTVARQDIQIARSAIGVARSAFLPQAGLSSGYTYNSPLANGQSFVALNGVREYQVVAGTTLEIDTSGRLRAALARTHADHDIATANSLIARRDLRRTVSAAYFRVLLARHLIDAAEASLTEAGSFRQRVQALMTGGEVARADLVKADAQLAFLQQTLTAAQLEAQLANQDLASFWTPDVNARLSLEDPLLTQPPPDPIEQVPAASYLRRPEFNLLEAERRGFQADYRRERAQLFPQVGVVYQYGLDANRLSFADRGSATFLTVSLPIFDWFRIRNTAGQFSLRVAQTEANRAVANRTLSRDLQAALARVQMIWQQIETTKRQVQTSEENLRLARVRYEGGEGPALDVVAAQQQLQQARANYYIVLADYGNARADLEVARGQ